MNKRGVFSYILIFSILVYTIFYRLYIYTNILKYAELITASFFLVLFFISILFFGFQKDKVTRNQKDITGVLFVSLVIYFSIIYSVGLILGFLNNAYSLSARAIFNNVFFVFITIVFTELLRYNLVVANKDNKFKIILTSLVIASFEIIYSINSYSFESLFSIFKFITISVLPIIANNALSTYYSYRIGYKPALLYNLILKLYIFFVPLLPNLGDYLTATFNLLLPFVIFLISFRIMVVYEKKYIHTFIKPRKFNILDAILISIFLVFAYLISGFGTYHLIGIASGSMSPYIERGDAVIIKKVEESELQVKDIIAFKSGDKIIVHRIIDIKEEKGKKLYLTKGDANNTDDGNYISFKNIKGKIQTKIPYIAYPTIMFDETTERN